MPVSVVGRVSPDHATVGVKAPVWAVEKTTQLNHFGREPFWSMARSVSVARLVVGIVDAMMVGSAKT